MFQENKAPQNLALRALRKISRYRVFSGPYFPVFSPNTGKYGQKKLRIRALFTQWGWSHFHKNQNVSFGMYMRKKYCISVQKKKRKSCRTFAVFDSLSATLRELIQMLRNVLSSFQLKDASLRYPAKIWFKKNILW